MRPRAPALAWLPVLLMGAQITVADDLGPAFVLTANGALEGYKDTATSGRDFFSFTGIPYARPPLGPLRFKDPQPAATWEGVWDASRASPPCPQHLYTNILERDFNKPIGQEDCLLLNVFTPRINDLDSPALPVVVWYHGGGYILGDSSTYQPHSWLVEDVVLVVVQYRLNALGFLSTEDDVAPGNLGLKDQTLSLRWVQENIAVFGGNAASVTIGGESAGASSVHFHLITEESQGLFDRAMLHSGAANCHWGFTDNAREMAYALGEYLSCPTGTSQQLIDCLQRKPYKQVVGATGIFYEIGFFPLGFIPIIDGKYITAHPVQLMKEGRYLRVDVLAGYTSHEGAWLSNMLYSSDEMFKGLTENFDDVAPTFLGFPSNSIDSVGRAKDAFNHYHGNDMRLAEQPKEFTDMTSDRFFKVCVDNAAQSLVQNNAGSHARVFLYELQHRGAQSFIDLFPMKHVKDKSFAKDWVAHCDDLAYLFPGSAVFKAHENEDDKQMTKLMLKLWANFAKTGNPTPDASLGFVWEAAAEERFRHLALRLRPSMEDDQGEKARNYWNSIPLPENILADPEKFQTTNEEEVEQEKSAQNERYEL